MNFKFTVIILTFLVIFMATVASAPVELSKLEKGEIGVKMYKKRSGGNGGTHCCQPSTNVPTNE